MIHKYRAENMERYRNHVNMMRHVPNDRIVYMDEVGRMVDIDFRERLNDVLEKVSRETVSKYYDRCKEARPHLM